MYPQHQLCHEWVWGDMRDNRPGSFNIPEWHITKSGQEPINVKSYRPGERVMRASVSPLVQVIRSHPTDASPSGGLGENFITRSSRAHMILA